MDTVSDASRLEKFKTEPVPGLFNFDGTCIAAICTRIYDGDSLRITFYHKDEPVTVALRVLGIDTPEIRSRDSREKDLAKQARARARELLNKQIVQVELGGTDKYGRTLGTIRLADGRDYSSLMITERLALPYTGGTKQTFESLYTPG